MPLEMQGSDDLRDDLTNMAANLEFGAGVNRALEAGAVPIKQQMIANAASDPKIITGALHTTPSIKPSTLVARRLILPPRRGKLWVDEADQATERPAAVGICKT